VQRTAAKCCKFHRFVRSSASRTRNGPALLPVLKRWAIVIQSASRTKKKYFWSKGPLRGLAQLLMPCPRGSHRSPRALCHRPLPQTSTVIFNS